MVDEVIKGVYCGTCKERVDMYKLREITLQVVQVEKNGETFILKEQPYITGECPVCGTRLDSPNGEAILHEVKKMKGGD